MDRDWFDYATLAATWFAAVGTVAAVCVALWQSTRRQDPKAHVWTSVVSGGGMYQLTVHVNNRGLGAFTVQDIDFFDKKKRTMMIFPDGYPDSRQLPKLASPGQTVSVTFMFKWPDVLGEDAPHRIVVKEAAGRAFHAYRDPWANDWARMPLRHRVVGRLQRLRGTAE